VNMLQIVRRKLVTRACSSVRHSRRRYCVSALPAPERPSVLGIEADGNTVLGGLDPHRKVGIIFTCNVCTERCAKSFSHHSYTKGVVIIECPSCKNRHLIADNLGWFKDTPTNVETMAIDKGESVRRITQLTELDELEGVHGLGKFKDLFVKQSTPTTVE